MINGALEFTLLSTDGEFDSKDATAIRDHEFKQAKPAILSL